MVLIDLQVDGPALCSLNDACRMLPSGGLQEEAQEHSFYMRGSKGLRGSPMVNFRAHFLRSLVAFTTYVFADWHIFILHLICSSLLSCRSPRHPSLSHPAIFMSSTKATNSSYTSFSDGRSSSPAYRYKPVGIVNEFNTCFLNSTFQAVRDFFSDTCMDH